jgi:hypothetical protein
VISLSSVAAVIGGQLISWGKFIQKLNGFGERLGEAEMTVNKLEALSDAHTLQIQRITDRMDYQIQTMSKIDEKAQQCLDTVDRHQREIIGRFDLFLQKKGEDQIAMRERIAKLEQRVSDNAGKIRDLDK